nr:hypothetical protein [Tanacetum cinerariifolium]
ERNLKGILQGRIERKDDDNVVAKEVNAAEPTVFNDEKVTMTMAQTLIKLKVEKARLLDEKMAKRMHDKEVEQAAAREKQEQDDLKRAQELQQPSPTHEPLPPLHKPITTPPQAPPAPPSSPLQEQQTTPSVSDMTLLNTLMETYTTLSHKVATLEKTKLLKHWIFSNSRGRLRD